MGTGTTKAPHRFSAAAAGTLSKREAERQVRALRKAGKSAGVGRDGQSGFRVIVKEGSV